MNSRSVVRGGEYFDRFSNCGLFWKGRNYLVLTGISGVCEQSNVLWDDAELAVCWSRLKSIDERQKSHRIKKINREPFQNSRPHKGDVQQVPFRGPINIRYQFYVLLSVQPGTILQINPTRCTILLGMFISLLYMFRATMCPSSGEITVSVWHWYLSLCMGGVRSAGWSVPNLANKSN